MAERRRSEKEGTNARKEQGAPRTKRPEKSVAVSPARVAAFAVLLEIEAGGAHSDDLLHAAGFGAPLHGLSDVDRRLTTALVLGVLRWQIALDARLHRHLSRPGLAIAPEVMIALRLGAFQLLHMDRIPAHAALSESVALTRKAGHERATGMVNAVLRKLAASPKTEVPRVFERPAVFAERLGHPAWMVERWTKIYGRDAALEVCEAGKREPDAGGEAVFASWEGLPDIDAGSRLVAELASAAAPEIGEGVLRVWDCCAAPGGKTAVLGRRLQGVGAAGDARSLEILATDISRRRLAHAEERLGDLAMSAGTGGVVRCRTADARTLPGEEGLFDLVLCDVPCSGTGTLARNPEIRLRMREEDLGRQAERQTEILRAAMERTRPGGRVVYSTCSLEPEECEAVLNAVLAKSGARWHMLNVSDLLATLQSSGSLQVETDGWVRERALRTLPGVHKMDGFYAAVIEREQSL